MSTTRSSATPNPHGPGFWVVSKYADVQAVSRDPVTYSSDQDRGGVTLEKPETLIAGRGAKVLIAMDPPEHTRHRKLVNRGFTPRMINALEPRIREMVVRILDRAIAKGTCNFVIDAAAELPLEVIAELIGVPNEDRHKIFEWTNQSLGAADGGEVDPEYSISEDRIRQSRIEMFLYVQELCKQRRNEPRDDIMSELVQAELDGDKLTDFELNARVSCFSLPPGTRRPATQPPTVSTLSWNTRGSTTSSCGTPRARSGARPKRSCGGHRRSCT